MDSADLRNRFDYHAPNEEKRKAHESIRQVCLTAAQFIDQKTPDGREKSLAITHLEEAMFWANAALARSTG